MSFLHKTSRLAILILASSCSTFVSNRKDDGERSGFGYSLPIPALLATPQNDGTVKTEIVYLPDSEERYVYKAKSLISSYTLKVELENGTLLKSVSLDATAADAAAEAAKAAGAVGKAAIDTEAASRAEAEKEEKAALDRARLAQLAVVKAQAKVDTLRAQAGANPNAAQLAAINAAELELAVAVAERDVAREGAALLVNSVLDNPDGSAAGADCAWGPVLYRIRMDDQSVWLERAPFLEGWQTATASASTCDREDNHQREFRTSSVGLPTPAPRPAAKKPSFEFTGSSVLSQGGNGRYELTLAVKDGPLGTVDTASSQLIKLWPGGASERVNKVPTYTQLANPERLAITLPADLPPGEYRLTFQFTYGKGQTTATDAVSFVIPG